MARRLNGTNQNLVFAAGALAGVHTYGTIVMLIKRGSVGSVWHCPVYTGTGGASDWGLAADLTNGNQMWFGIGTGQVTDSYVMNQTDRWYLVAITKPSGTGSAKFHYREQISGSWGSWTHQTVTGFANPTGPTVSQARLGSFAGFDWFNGDIAAVGVYRGWDPSNTDIENADFESTFQSWLDVAPSATDGAAVWVPGRLPVADAIPDLTGGGANQTSQMVGTVVDGPTDFQEHIVGTKLQQIATAVNPATGNTLAVNYSSDPKPKAGDLVVVWGGRNNVNNDPLDSSSVTDGQGNTYSRVAGVSGVSSDAGIVQEAFYSILTNDWPSGTVTVTWTLPSGVNKARLMRVEHYAGPVVGFRGSAVGTSGVGAPSAALDVEDDDLVIGSTVFEHSTASTITPDSDTTNGSWSTQTNVIETGGSTLAGIKQANQYKLVTASGTQTYNVSNSVTTNVDSVAIVLAFQTVAGGGGGTNYDDTGLATVISSTVETTDSLDTLASSPTNITSTSQGVSALAVTADSSTTASATTAAADTAGATAESQTAAVTTVAVLTALQATDSGATTATATVVAQNVLGAQGASGTVIESETQSTNVLGQSESLETQIASETTSADTAAYGFVLAEQIDATVNVNDQITGAGNTHYSDSVATVVASTVGSSSVLGAVVNASTVVVATESVSTELSANADSTTTITSVSTIFDYQGGTESVAVEITSTVTTTDEPGSGVLISEHIIATVQASSIAAYNAVLATIINATTTTPNTLASESDIDHVVVSIRVGSRMTATLTVTPTFDVSVGKVMDTSLGVT